MDSASTVQLSRAVRALIRVARPVFKRRHDRVAYAVHAYYLCHGYTLVGVGASTDEGTAPAEDAEEVSLEGWNDNGELYVFTYAHSQKELQPVVVKCMCMGNILVICVSSLVADGSLPRTLNVNVNEVTTDVDDIMQGYASLEALVGEFATELGEYPLKPAKEERKERQITETETRREERAFHPLMEPAPLQRGVPDGRSDLFPEGVLAAGERLRGGGMCIGMNDPRFAPSLRHPELHPGQVRPGPGGMRYDPIAPPGMPGYMPDDFQTNRNRFHPDLAHPGPRRDFDPDNMFG